MLRLIAPALVLLAGSTLLLTESRGQPCATPKAPEAKAAYTKWVCPIYCYAHFLTYCSYYSEECKGYYVSLDALCGIPTDATRCNDPKFPCEEILLFKTPKGAPPAAKTMQHAAKSLKKGIKKKGLIPDPTVRKGAQHGRLLGQPLLVRLEVNPGMFVNVALYLVLNTPPVMNGKQLPARIFGHGLEIVYEGETTLDVPNSSLLMVDGKICTVQLGSVTYQVILDEGTKVTAPKAR